MTILALRKARIDACLVTSLSLVGGYLNLNDLGQSETRKCLQLQVDQIVNEYREIPQTPHAKFFFQRVESLHTNVKSYGLSADTEEYLVLIYELIKYLETLRKNSYEGCYRINGDTDYLSFVIYTLYRNMEDTKDGFTPLLGTVPTNRKKGIKGFVKRLFK
jgi:hypothetical protein